MILPRVGWGGVERFSRLEWRHGEEWNDIIKLDVTIDVHNNLNSPLSCLCEPGIPSMFYTVYRCLVFGVEWYDFCRPNEKISDKFRIKLVQGVRKCWSLPAYLSVYATGPFVEKAWSLKFCIQNLFTWIIEVYNCHQIQIPPNNLLFRIFREYLWPEQCPWTGPLQIRR